MRRISDLRWFLISIFLASAALPAAERFDILIRGGKLLDGSGNPWRYADVGIKSDRIVALGFIPNAATATTVLDAHDRFVTPGFIDAHSHAAPAIGTEKLAAAIPVLLQGITTVMVNPDGGGPAELLPQLNAIRKVIPGVNVAPMIGHNAVRVAVMGNENRAPMPEELKKMEDLIRAGMELGAFGFSAGPFYVPGKYSKTDELIALARVAAEFPGAFYTAHIRDEASYDVGVVAAAQEVIDIARAAKLPGVITHIKCIGPDVWGKSKEIIDRVNAARADGVEIWADQYAYTASSTGLQAALVPGWAQEGGRAAQTARLSNPEQRAAIRKEMLENLARRAGAHNIMIAHCESDASLEGKRLDEIAGAKMQEPIDAAIDILKNGGASIVSFNMDEKDLIAFMRQPWTMTCTDGALVEFGQGAEHPRAYGAFPRKLRRYALEEGVITIEQAVHSSTGLTASVVGLKDRGVLCVGAFADVLVIDPKLVTDNATYEKPHAYSSGMDFVLVNGRLAVANGKVTENRYGRVLLRENQ